LYEYLGIDAEVFREREGFVRRNKNVKIWVKLGGYTQVRCN